MSNPSFSPDISLPSLAQVDSSIHDAVHPHLYIDQIDRTSADFATQNLDEYNSPNFHPNFLVSCDSSSGSGGLHSRFHTPDFYSTSDSSRGRRPSSLGPHGSCNSFSASAQQLPIPPGTNPQFIHYVKMLEQENRRLKALEEENRHLRKVKEENLRLRNTNVIIKYV